MTTDTRELPGGGRPNDAVEFPPLKSVDELDRHVEATYGADVLKTLRNSTGDQASVLEELHSQGLNGRAERLHELYNLHQQEFARKESLLGSVWEGTKEVVTAPFRWTWSAFKSHPVLTTAAIASLALGGTAAYLYYAGQLEAALTAVGADKVVAFFTETATELAPMTPDTPIVPGGGEAGIPGGAPSMPVEPPTFGV